MKYFTLFYCCVIVFYYKALVRNLEEMCVCVSLNNMNKYDDEQLRPVDIQKNIIYIWCKKIHVWMDIKWSLTKHHWFEMSGNSFTKSTVVSGVLMARINGGHLVPLSDHIGSIFREEFYNEDFTFIFLTRRSLSLGTTFNIENMCHIYMR